MARGRAAGAYWRAHGADAWPHPPPPHPHACRRPPQRKRPLLPVARQARRNGVRPRSRPTHCGSARARAPNRRRATRHTFGAQRPAAQPRARTLGGTRHSTLQARTHGERWACPVQSLSRSAKDPTVVSDCVGGGPSHQRQQHATEGSGSSARRGARGMRERAHAPRRRAGNMPPHAPLSPQA